MRGDVRAALAEIGRSAMVVPVHEQNLASLAVMTRCGFIRLGPADFEPDNPAHTPRHVVLAIGM